ncbi:MAG: hypothetical protein WAL50_14500 [Kineosporiaceae bacterium]
MHPTERSSDASNTTRVSVSSSPSAAANAVATAHVRSPFSNGIPEARSVVSDRAESTSATRMLRTWKA